MLLIDRLHKEGNTIILVTHEEDIALHAHRRIRLRDGKIEADDPIKNRKIITQPVTATA
jgi:putative ABC transport system ATP-binding protein